MIELLLQGCFTAEPMGRGLRYESQTQLRRASPLATAVVLALSAMAGTCLSQQRATVAHGRTEEAMIAYRLAQGKTMHFDDAQKASQHLATVEKLGCEVSQGNHEGHSDLTYRCAKWKVLTVANDKLAHQWEEWLKGAGFETIHGHSAGTLGHEHGHDHAGDHGENHHHHPHEGEAHEEISYRLSTWLTVHPRNEAEAQELVAIAKGLGCDVRESQHAGHRDISISCPEWKHAEFPSHEAVEAWQQWLTNNGFETKHSH